MNAEDTRTADPDPNFDPQRLRSITDMQRSRDDRFLGGVCSGAAKYLNIDPTIVRVVIAVLTIAGFAGVILYVAAWILLPTEGEDRSLAAEWFKLDKNEEHVRVVGLVIAAVLAALAVVGDTDYAWWGVSWLFLPLAALYYLFVVRPRRRRAYESPRVSELAADKPELAADRAMTRISRTRSPALALLTISIAAIAIAVTRIYAEYHDGTPWTTYVAIALGVVAVGLLASSFFGDGGLLIALGIALAIALAISSVLPSGRIGAQQPTPMTDAEVHATYQHGIGLLELDLTQVTNPQDLMGRTITLDAGIGQTKLIVPDGLKVSVAADLKAGEISLFGQTENGTDVSIDQTATEDDGTALTIHIDQTLGNIEVISR